MRRTHRAAVAVVALLAPLLAAPGCQSGLTSRAYRLDRPTTDTALINSVLDEEWARHSVMSESRVTDEGYAVVSTTPRGHSAIRSALRQGRP
jgi:hypothetical protein